MHVAPQKMTKMHKVAHSCSQVVEIASGTLFLHQAHEIQACEFDCSSNNFEWSNSSLNIVRHMFCKCKWSMLAGFHKFLTNQTCNCVAESRLKIASFNVKQIEMWKSNTFGVELLNQFKKSVELAGSPFCGLIASWFSIYKITTGKLTCKKWKLQQLNSNCINIQPMMARKTTMWSMPFSSWSDFCQIFIGKSTAKAHSACSQTFSWFANCNTLAFEFCAVFLLKKLCNDKIDKWAFPLSQLKCAWIKLWFHSCGSKWNK